MASKVKPIVLSDRDRAELRRRFASKSLPAREVERARIVLLAEEGLAARDVAELVGCSSPRCSHGEPPMNATVCAASRMRHAPAAHRCTSGEARVVPYVRGSFFAGEEFRDFADSQRRAERWCVQQAAMRLHGTIQAPALGGVPRRQKRTNRLARIGADTAMGAHKRVP